MVDHPNTMVDLPNTMVDLNNTMVDCFLPLLTVFTIVDDFLPWLTVFKSLWPFLTVSAIFDRFWLYWPLLTFVYRFHRFWLFYFLIFFIICDRFWPLKKQQIFLTLLTGFGRISQTYKGRVLAVGGIFTVLVPIFFILFLVAFYFFGYFLEQIYSF